jgi:endonuclease-3
MTSMASSTKDWEIILQPLLKKYGSRKHPLEYQNYYQLLVMVILSAQTTDALINKIAPEFFQRYPTMESLAQALPEDLYPLLKSVRGFRKKAEWIVAIARKVKTEDNIPKTINELTKLPGVGRKTANLILREMDEPPQGIFVDLHTLRVVPRLGITNRTKPDEIEKALLEILPKKYWHKAGMALSYLGRETCRPKEPLCKQCLLKNDCSYYSQKKNR